LFAADPYKAEDIAISAATIDCGGFREILARSARFIDRHSGDADGRWLSDRLRSGTGTEERWIQPDRRLAGVKLTLSRSCGPPPLTQRSEESRWVEANFRAVQSRPRYPTMLTEVGD
jgi:hypothetical protein